jgi:hypothetical protein
MSKQIQAFLVSIIVLSVTGCKQQALKQTVAYDLAPTVFAQTEGNVTIAARHARSKGLIKNLKDYQLLQIDINNHSGHDYTLQGKNITLPLATLYDIEKSLSGVQPLYLLPGLALLGIGAFVFYELCVASLAATAIGIHASGHDGSKAADKLKDLLIEHDTQVIIATGSTRTCLVAIKGHYIPQHHITLHQTNNAQDLSFTIKP